MPIQQPFYINGPSLASATAVFLDAALTLCADDGFYSDGSITREQVGCVLLPENTCPDCTCTCITFINNTAIPQIARWVQCPDVFSYPVYFIPPFGTFKACGSNPSTDDLPGSVTWIIGDTCDRTNAYPACNVPKCHTLQTTAGDLTSTCTITYYDMYGVFQTLIAYGGDVNKICAQVGSVNVTCTGTAFTSVTQSNTVCTYFDECI